MDLIPENPIQEKKTSKAKISFIIVIILIVILLIVAISIWLYTEKLKSQLFKVNIDNIYNSKASSEEGLFLFENGKVYTSISNICSYIGYNYYPGGYGQYTEDKTKCYVNNSKEIVTFSSGSNEIVKYPSDNGQSQTFQIDEEVVLRGEKLYISENGLEKAFNLLLDYYSENNTLNISTLPYLTATYEEVFPEASLERSEFSDTVKFNNEKALLNNLVVIHDEETNLYGVALRDSTDKLNTIITTRYAQVEYMEGTSDFIITTQDNKVGIIGSDSITKIKPDYDSINVIDKNTGLYLVSSNDKQGVINSNGKIIIHQDFDSIGLDQGSYDDPNVTNRYLLYGNCIPVKLNDKWGLIDINGETITEVQFDGFGCKEVGNTGAKNTNGIVIIPDIKGIVVKINFESEDKKTSIEKYAIINALGEKMTDAIIDEAYMTTVSDVTSYYVKAQGQTIDIVNWWKEQVSKQSENKNTNETTNEIREKNTNDITDNSTNEDANNMRGTTSSTSDQNVNN